MNILYYDNRCLIDLLHFSNLSIIPTLTKPLQASRKGDNNDNRLIMKLHEEIYPEQAELADIKKLVKVAEDNLKTISDKMREETENELKDKGEL